MTVTALETGKRSERIVEDQIHLGPDVAGISRMDPVTAGGARGAGDSVEGVVGVGEPEGVVIEAGGERFEWFDGAAEAKIVDVLPRNEVHITVGFVVGGKKIVKGLVFGVVGIAVAGGVIVLQAQARRGGRAGPGVTAGDMGGQGFMGERGTGGGFLEAADLPRPFGFVLPAA